MSARALPKMSAEGPAESTGSARPITLSENDTNRFLSLINAPLKGLYKGVLGAGKLAIQLSPEKLLGLNRLSGDKSRDPREHVLDKAGEFVEKMLPTQPEFAESTLERFGEQVPYVASGGVGGLIRAGIGALGGQLVEEAGGGPILQGLAEAGPQMLPSLEKKLVAANAQQEEILRLGRSRGMSEEQLAPLMPEKGKKRFFGKFAFAGPKAEEAVAETHKGVKGIYRFLESSPQAQQMLSTPQLQKFATDINRIAIKMPHAVRSQVQKDAQDLVASVQRKGGLSGEELMNFYHDISSRYNIGRKELELFKGPIKDALHDINPRLAKDFETVNKMYQKSIQIGRILKPSEFEHLISLGEAYEVGASVANLDAGRLTRLLGVVGFRKFSEKMLTSPRLQNLIKKTQDAVLKNNLPMIKKLGDLILAQYKKEESQSE